ncbi:hypothetical protein ARMGADRAFT_1092968 [Armillaria gallica]|uniref:Uncharacterized protein n=1 Tax=Armillaria gallica TaxID=47427 RepID=A0A2H3CWC3_ARMGA|nr:hypothetical protein ARMGADRAFT_1092968 [Armillaria gallica]
MSSSTPLHVSDRHHRCPLITQVAASTFPITARKNQLPAIPLATIPRSMKLADPSPIACVVCLLSSFPFQMRRVVVETRRICMNTDWHAGWRSLRVADEQVIVCSRGGGKPPTCSSVLRVWLLDPDGMPSDTRSASTNAFLEDLLSRYARISAFSHSPELAALIHTNTAPTTFQTAQLQALIGSLDAPITDIQSEIDLLQNAAAAL